MKALLAVAALLADPVATNVPVERGVTVPVLVTREVRAGAFGSLPASQTVKFAIAQDVIVDGYVIAKAGDLAEGHYTTQSNQTKRTFETTTSREVTLVMDDAVNFCGDTLHLEFERTFVSGVRSGFLSFGVHGHDAVFGKGSVLVASTDRFEKSVCAQATSAVPAPLPRNAVRSDDTVAPPNGSGVQNR